MTAPVSIRHSGPILRKHPKLPRYVVIPARLVEPWKLTGTTVVTGTLNGTDLGRRTIKPWDSARSCWFIEVPEPLCREAQVDTGSVVALELRMAPEAMPEELAALLAADPIAQSVWGRLTPSQQRRLRERIAAAKTSAGRMRRARAEVLGDRTTS